MPILNENWISLALALFIGYQCRLIYLEWQDKHAKHKKKQKLKRMQYLKYKSQKPTRKKKDTELRSAVSKEIMASLDVSDDINLSDLDMSEINFAALVPDNSKTDSDPTIHDDDLKWPEHLEHTDESTGKIMPPVTYSIRTGEPSVPEYVEEFNDYLRGDKKQYVGSSIADIYDHMTRGPDTSEGRELYNPSTDGVRGMLY
jgi:hypothetical protein